MLNVVTEVPWLFGVSDVQNIFINRYIHIYITISHVKLF